MSAPKKIIVSVSSDLSTDQRVQKICASLANNGFQVELIGRKLANSPVFDSTTYSVKRFGLWFNNGPLFYANLNVRLLFNLLFSKANIFYANDLDTLPANYLASKWKRKPLIYDSHEYFTEVPELIQRPKVQQFWRRIEKWIVPQLSYCLTVTHKIAEAYKEEYGRVFQVMRNFPLLQKTEQKQIEKENAIIYQGALNVGRGLEELIKAMVHVDAILWIAGTGDIDKNLRRLVDKQRLTGQVVFLGRLSPKELRGYTLRAKIGVSVEHKNGLSYTYALPNKVFDYIHAQTPVLYSDLTEVKKTLGEIVIGEELQSYEPKKLGNQLSEMLNSAEYENWQKSCLTLKEQLNWQQEEKVLLNIVNNIG